MSRLWVVEVEMFSGEWGVCDFGTGNYASTNYYKAHELKRAQYKYLQPYNREWYKKCFRVREYTPKEIWSNL